jgi:LuxR family quorum-sensing system transcriptional regulator CciR
MHCPPRARTCRKLAQEGETVPPPKGSAARWIGETSGAHGRARKDWTRRLFCGVILFRRIRWGENDVGRMAEVQAFVDACRAIRTPRDLDLLMGDVTSSMGFDHFALLHHVPIDRPAPDFRHMVRGERVGLNNYPSGWVETYVGRQMVARDPVVLASDRSDTAFRWEDLAEYIEVDEGVREHFAEAEAAGMGLGYTVPAHVPGEANGSCSFAMRPGRALPEKNLPMAQMIGAFSFAAARVMVMQARLGRRDIRRPLTDRQLQCTILVGRGMTEAQIAARLGIARETVKRHLKEARATYDVSKSIQLLVRALHDGQLTIADLLND